MLRREVVRFRRRERSTLDGDVVATVAEGILGEDARHLMPLCPRQRIGLRCEDCSGEACTVTVEDSDRLLVGGIHPGQSGSRP